MSFVAYSVFTAICWGTNKIVVRKALEKSNASLSVLITLLSSIPFFLIFWILTNPQANVTWDLWTLSVLAAAGLSEYVLGNGLLYVSIKSIGASRAALLVRSQLVFAAVFGTLWLQEEFGLMTLAGCIVFVLGFVLISRSHASESVDPPKKINLLMKGTFCGLLAGVAWGAVYILARTGSILVGNSQISAFVAMLFAAVFQMGLCATTRFVSKKELPTDKSSLLYLVITGAITAAGAIAYYTALSSSTSVVLVASITNLAPLVTLLLTHFFLGQKEALNRRVAFGGLLVLLAVYMIVLS